MNLDHLAEEMFVKFLYWKVTVTPCPSLSTVLFGRKSLSSPHIKCGVMVYLPEYGASTYIIWNSSAWEL